MQQPFLAVIGGGNMGKAIVVGGVQAGILTPQRVCVADPAGDKRARFAALGVHVVKTAAQALEWLHAKAPDRSEGQVLLAIKPQSLSRCADELRRLQGVLEGRVVITILAGATSNTIRASLGADCRVVRAMPNLPAAIGRGVTAICLGESTESANADFARGLFRGIGPTVIELDESMMDAFTAVAGSGPAYVFYLAEAMIDGAMNVGFGRDEATQIVRGVVAGAALMLEQSADQPAALRAAVTSKGGTTEAALAVLDATSVRHDIAQAILAARDRGRALG